MALGPTQAGATTQAARDGDTTCKVHRNGSARHDSNAWYRHNHRHQQAKDTRRTFALPVRCGSASTGRAE